MPKLPTPRLLKKKYPVDEFRSCDVLILGEEIPKNNQRIKFPDTYVKRPEKIGSNGTHSIQFFEENGIKCAHFVSLYVPKEERKKGYGKALVEHAINLARERGVKLLRTNTTNHNDTKPIRTILFSQGFEIANRQGEHKLTLEKKL